MCFVWYQWVQRCKVRDYFLKDQFGYPHVVPLDRETPMADDTNRLAPESRVGIVRMQCWAHWCDGCWPLSWLIPGYQPLLMVSCVPTDGIGHSDPVGDPEHDRDLRRSRWMSCQLIRIRHIVHPGDVWTCRLPWERLNWSCSGSGPIEYPKCEGACYNYRYIWIHCSNL